MKVVDSPQAVKQRFIGLLFGDGGVGKTQLATSVLGSEKSRALFGERLVIGAFDQGSDPLLSVRPEIAARCVVATPELWTNPATKQQEYRPYQEGAQFCRFNWKEKYPDVGTIIFDGWSGWSDDCLRQISNAGIISSADKGDRHLSFGDKADGTLIQQPIVGDYGFAQNMMIQTLKLFFRCQSQLNIIVICNEDWWKPEGGSLDTMKGGPMSVGGKSIGKLTKEFDNVFRVLTQTNAVQEGGKVVQKTRRLVVTERRGVWEGKIRNGAGANPLPEFELGVNTTPFWEAVIEKTRAADPTVKSAVAA